MSNSRINHFHHLSGILFGLLVLAVLILPMNAMGQTFENTTLEHNDDSGRAIWAYDDKTLLTSGGGTLTIADGDIIITDDGTATANDGTPHSIAGIATNDSAGSFDLGTGLLTVSGKVDDGGTNTLYGFIYLSDTAFAGTINGAGRDITIDDDGTSEIIGVYFRNETNNLDGKSHSRGDINTTNTFEFGNITVTSNSVTAGATAFAAGDLLGGTIMLGDLTAMATAGKYAYGAEFSGIGTGTSVTVGDVIVEAGTDGIAAGFIVDNHNGGGNNAGTITIDSVTATSEDRAFGVNIVGNNTGHINIKDVYSESTSTITSAFGIRIGNGTGGTIDFTGDMEVIGEAGAYGIRSNGNIIGGGNIEVTTEDGWAVGVSYTDGTPGRSIVNGTVVLGDITATSNTSGDVDAGGAYGFAAAGIAAGDGNSVTLGDVKAYAEGGPDTDAAGVEFRGSVLGDLSIENITVTAGARAQGLTVTSGSVTIPADLGTASNRASIGGITVKATAADGVARGILVEPGKAFLDLQGGMLVEAKGTGGEAYGIWIANGDGGSMNLGNNTITVDGGAEAYGIRSTGTITGGATIIANANTGWAVGAIYGKDGTRRATVNGHVTFGNITATSNTNLGSAGGGAYGFSAGGVASGAGNSVTLGDVKAYAEDGGSAAGVEFQGDVLGNLTIGSLDVEAIDEAFGLIVTNGGNLGTSGTHATLGTINVSATGKEGYAVGILVDAGNAFLALEGNITVENDASKTSITPNGDGQRGAYGIRALGDVNIRLDGGGSGTLGINGDTAGIWTGGDLLVNLNGKNLELDGDLGADVGNNLSVLGGNSTGTANLGKTSVAGTFSVGANTIVSVDAGSTFGTATAVAGTLNTAGGTINQLTGTGMVTSTGALTIAGTGTGTAFAGTINANANALALNGGTFSGNLTGTGATTVASGATLSPGGTGIGLMTVNGNLTMNTGSTLLIDFVSESSHDLVVVNGTASIGAIIIDLTNLAAGEYTLLTSTGLTYTDNTATVMINGSVLGSTGGRLDAITATTEKSGNNLLLTLAGTIANVDDLVWKVGQGGIWNSDTGKWTGSETDFVSGDAVTFSGAAGETVTIAGSGVTVADMTVTGAGDWVFNGNIVGDASESTLTGAEGKLVKEGAGTMTFNGVANFKGGIDVKGGTLQVGGALGTVGGDGKYTYAENILNDNALIFSSPADQTLSGVISGTGSLTKQGTGTLILTGANTYTGATNINVGTLLVNGSLGTTGTHTGLVTVGNNGTLGGNGTLYGDVVINGTLSPGNSTGTITIYGDVTIAGGATYLYEIDTSDWSHDLLVVNGSHIVTIDDTAKLNIVFLPSGTTARPTEGAQFQVIALENGADFADGNEFNLVGDYRDFFTLEFQDDGLFAVYEYKGLNPSDFSDFVSDNASNVFDALSGMTSDQAFALAGIFSALGDVQDDPRAYATALGQLHGEVFATSKEAAARQQRRFQQLIPNGREYSSIPKEWNLWGTFTGNWNSRQKIDMYSGYDLGSAGVAVGLDRAFLRQFLFGAAVGYDYTDLSFKTIESTAKINAVRTMLYGSWFNGEYYFDVYGGYTKNFYNTERNINIGTFNTVAKGSYNDNMGSFGIEVGRVWQAYGNMFTPSIGLQGVWLNCPDVVEKDGGVANLFVHGSDYTSLRVPVGVKLSRIFTTGHVSWVPELRATYIAELADDSARITTSFNGVRGVVFDADSGKWGQHSGRLGIGLGVLFSNNVNFRIDYDHEVYNYTGVDSLSATLGVQW